MFTPEEKEILMTSLITRRNVIETGNPYISANDAFRRKEQRKTAETMIEGVRISANVRSLSKEEIEEIIRINRLITKTQTTL